MSILDNAKNMLDKFVEKGEELKGNLIQAGEKTVEAINAEFDCEGSLEIVDDIPEADKVKLEAVAKCPYLEEKCGDLPCPCPKYQAWQMMEDDPELINKKITELGIDPNQDAWNVMMSMQKIFAGRFMSTENRTKEEIDHWVNDYLVCIADELAELATSNSCRGEMQKEVIDIAHFVMDVFIAGEYTADEIKRRYIELFSPNIVDVKSFLAHAYELQQVEDDPEHYSWRSNYITRMLIASAKVRQQISWKHWKKPNASIDREKLLDANVHLFKAFMDLVVRTMTVDELRDIYIKKNVENILRQELGY